MPLPDTIQHRLAAALQAGRPLDLLNSFKGVPVRHKAAIQDIRDEEVCLHKLGREVVCLELEREVVVLGEGDEEAWHANVAEVQVKEGRACLTNLRYAGSRLDNRLMIRVKPQAPLGAHLDVGGQPVAGQVADLSMGGMAVLVSAPPADLLLKAPMTVHLVLELPSGAADLVGLIRSARPEGSGKRLGIDFPQDAHVSAIVGYVLQRRTEILTELQQAYEARVTQA